MLILPAEADEALVTTAVDRISKVISPTAGEVTKLDRTLKIADEVIRSKVLLLPEKSKATASPASVEA